MNLSISLATRGRPGFLARTVEHTLTHVREPGTKLVLQVDEDDSGTLSMQDKLKDPRIIWSIEPRPDSLGTKFNRVLRVAPADVYLNMVDYAPYTTPGFDSRILEAASVYSDGYAFVLGYHANFSFTQTNAVTHKVAEKMGGIWPEYFPFWFGDHWLEEIAKRTGRAVFADVWVDCTRKQDTQRKGDAAFWGAVFQYLEPERIAQATAIIDAPDFKVVPEEHKEALRRNWPSINYWSYLINQSLSSDNAPGDMNDAGYVRLVNAAKVIVEPRQRELEEKLKAAQAQRAA